MECRARKQGQQEDGAKCRMWADRNYMKEGPEAGWNLFREQKKVKLQQSSLKSKKSDVL